MSDVRRGDAQAGVEDIPRPPIGATHLGNGVGLVLDEHIEAAVEVDTPADQEAHRQAYLKRRRRQRFTRPIPALLSVLCGALIWELIGTFELVNPLFLPRFSLVAENLWNLIASGELSSHLYATLYVMVIGLALALAVSIPIGVLTGASKVADKILAPYINALNSLPRAITFMPLAIVVFGISHSSRIFIVLLSSSLPLLINVAAGVRTVDIHLMEMARSFNMSRMRSFRTVVLPSTVPHIFAGFRLAIGQSLIAVVIAELFASTEGIGYLLARASARYDIVRLWAMILVLAIIGVILSAASRRLERRFDAWRPE